MKRLVLLSCLLLSAFFFTVPNGLCVHNPPAFVGATSSMCLAYVITINPITAIIGASVALSTIAHKAYQTYTNQYSDSVQKTVPPTEISFAERSYYNQRAAELEAIKQEFLYIKNGLGNIRAFCSGDSASFTYQFLQKNSSQNIHTYNQQLKVLTHNEALLFNAQKQDLRTLREINLQCLEEEIISLQGILALHVDELITQMNAARCEHTKAQEQIHKVATLWNDNLSNITYAIALESYKADLLEDHLLNNFNQKLNELKSVAQYYASCTNIACIEKSTNIIQLLEKLAPIIAENDQWVVREKSRVAGNVKIVENHFVYRSIAVPPLKDAIKNELAKQRKDLNGKALVEASNKLVTVTLSGGPNNNKNNDDDESDKDSNNRTNSFKTTKEATEAAEKLGFKKTNYHSQRQPVFKKGNRYITPDRTSHNGGVWKMADSVDNLVDKTTRMGTYDKYLNRIGD